MTRSLKALLRRGLYLLPDCRVTMNKRYLGPFSFRLRRHRWLLRTNWHRDHTRNLAMFCTLVRRGDVVYDVGANIGYYSRYVLQQLAPSRVVAFEPMRQNVELLERNIELVDGDGKVRLVAGALGDREFADELQIDDIMGGTAVLNTVSGGAAASARRAMGLPPVTERVDVQSLDHFVTSNPAEPSPQVIKIDTEGAEVAVLTGARQLLSSSQAPRLLIATHGRQLATDCVSMLAAWGYHCFGFVRTGSTGGEVWSRLDSHTRWDLTDNNIICSRTESDVTMAPLSFSQNPPAYTR
jgi:FkbM family methyltransferase